MARTLKFKRKKPTDKKAVPKPEWMIDADPLVDADFVLYKAGLACDYDMHQVYYINDPKKETIEEFRGKRELNKWIELSGYVVGEHVAIRTERIVEPLDITLHTVKQMLIGIQKRFPRPLELFISGSGNFRNDVAREIPYKGGRLSTEGRDEIRSTGRFLKWLEDTESKYKEARKPARKEEIIQYMVKYWKAKVTDGIEADDAVGLEQCNRDNTIIVHQDKDINMIPGWHWDPFENDGNADAYYVDSWDADRNFYSQLLTGDKSTDNIPGLNGIGEAKAKPVLAGCRNAREMYEAVRSFYLSYAKDSCSEEEVDKILLNRGRLLWILRKPEMWKPPHAFLHAQQN